MKRFDDQDEEFFEYLTSLRDGQIETPEGVLPRNGLSRLHSLYYNSNFISGGEMDDIEKMEAFLNNEYFGIVSKKDLLLSEARTLVEDHDCNLNDLFSFFGEHPGEVSENDLRKYEKEITYYQAANDLDITFIRAGCELFNEQMDLIKGYRRTQDSKGPYMK